MVTIFNRLSQTIHPTVRDDAGVIRPLTIGANESLGPIERDTITPYTEGLARAGHILIREAN